MQTSHSDLAISAATTTRSVGGPSFSVESGTGGLFSVADGPMRVVVYRSNPSAPTTPPIFITLLLVSAVSGDTLTISGAADGHTDAAVAIGDTIANVPTAGDLKDLWTAVLAGGGGGSTFRQGAGVPSNSLGIDGDIYVDITTGDLYQREAGVYGTAIIKGYSAVVWQNGNGAPTTVTVDGDVYVDVDSGNLYQVKSAAWVLILNIAGSRWRNGSGVPSNSLGIDGDYYIDYTNGWYYQRQLGVYVHIMTVWSTPGSVWRNGAGVPSNATGIDGDYYLNVTNGDVYQRAAGVYAIIGNIKGPTGAAGATGATGAAGPAYSTLGSANQVLGTNNAATDFEYKTITAGSGVTITHSTGAVTIAATGGGGGSGTVTSVGLTAFSGISVTGSPITGAGTLALSTSLSGLIYGTGYSFISAVANVDYVQPSGNITGTAAGLSSTLAVASGGTGLTTLGAALQVLRTNAGATALEWATPSGGGGGTGDVTFTDSTGTTPTFSQMTTTLTELKFKVNGDLGTMYMILADTIGVGTGVQLVQGGTNPIDIVYTNDDATFYQRFETRSAYAYTSGHELQYGVITHPAMVVGVDTVQYYGGVAINPTGVWSYGTTAPRVALDVRGGMCLPLFVQATNRTLVTSDRYAGFSGQTAAIDVNLPNTSPPGQKFTVFDAGGLGATYPITISTFSGTIDGAGGGVTINTAYAYIEFLSLGGNAYKIVGRG